MKNNCSSNWLFTRIIISYILILATLGKRRQDRDDLKLISDFRNSVCSVSPRLRVVISPRYVNIFTPIPEMFYTDLPKGRKIPIRMAANVIRINGGFFFLIVSVGQICYRRSKLHDYCRILKVFASYFVRVL
jgi:hypothetical protein